MFKTFQLAGGVISVGDAATSGDGARTAMDPQCLQTVSARFQIELHPSKLHDVRDGVTEHLNGNLFR